MNCRDASRDIHLRMTRLLFIFLTLIISISHADADSPDQKLFENFEKQVKEYKEEFQTFAHPISPDKEKRYLFLLEQLGSLQYDLSLVQSLRSKLLSTQFSGNLSLAWEVWPGLVRVYFAHVELGQIIFLKHAYDGYEDYRWVKLTKPYLMGMMQRFQQLVALEKKSQVTKVEDTLVGLALKAVSKLKYGDTKISKNDIQEKLGQLIQDISSFKNPDFFRFYRLFLFSSKKTKIKKTGEPLVGQKVFKATLAAVLESLQIWDLRELNLLASDLKSYENIYPHLKTDLQSTRVKIQKQILLREEGKVKNFKGYVNLTLKHYQLMGEGVLEGGWKTLKHVAQEMYPTAIARRVMNLGDPFEHVKQGVGLVQSIAGLGKATVSANLSIYSGGHYGSFGKKTGEEVFQIWMAAALVKAAGKLAPKNGPTTYQIIPESGEGGRASGAVNDVVTHTNPNRLIEGFGSRGFWEARKYEVVDTGGPLKKVEVLGEETPLLRIGPRPKLAVAEPAKKAIWFKIPQKNGLPLLLAAGAAKDSITFYETDSSGAAYIPTPQIWKTTQLNVGGKLVYALTNGAQSLYFDRQGNIRSSVQLGGKQAAIQGIQGSRGSSSNQQGGDGTIAELERRYLAEIDNLDLLKQFISIAKRQNRFDLLKKYFREFLRTMNVQDSSERAIFKKIMGELVEEGMAYPYYLYICDLVREGIQSTTLLRIFYINYKVVTNVPDEPFFSVPVNDLEGFANTEDLRIKFSGPDNRVMVLGYNSIYYPPNLNTVSRYEGTFFFRTSYPVSNMNGDIIYNFQGDKLVSYNTAKSEMGEPIQYSLKHPIVEVWQDKKIKMLVAVDDYGGVFCINTETKNIDHQLETKITGIKRGSYAFNPHDNSLLVVGDSEVRLYQISLENGIEQLDQQRLKRSFGRGKLFSNTFNSIVYQERTRYMGIYNLGKKIVFGKLAKLITIPQNLDMTPNGNLLLWQEETPNHLVIHLRDFQGTFLHNFYWVRDEDTHDAQFSPDGKTLYIVNLEEAQSRVALYRIDFDIEAK